MCWPRFDSWLMLWSPAAPSFECEAVSLFDNLADAMGPRCYWQYASLLTRSVAVQLRAVPLVRLWCSGNTLACHAGIASSNLARCSGANYHNVFAHFLGQTAAKIRNAGTKKCKMHSCGWIAYTVKLTTEDREKRIRAPLHPLYRSLV